MVKILTINFLPFKRKQNCGIIFFQLLVKIFQFFTPSGWIFEIIVTYSVFKEREVEKSFEVRGKRGRGSEGLLHAAFWMWTL